MNGIIQTIAIVGIIWYVISQKHEVKNGKSVDQLSTKEKVLIWVLSFCNPILVGTIAYYGLRKLLPNKAKKIGNIAFIMLVVLAIILIVAILLDPSIIIKE